MKQQNELVKKLILCVYDDKNKNFKKCGREICIKLIEEAVALDKMINFKISNRTKGYFGDAHGFVNIVHINELIKYCDYFCAESL